MITKGKCDRCGYVTEINWNRRKGKPRFCRNCGAQFAEPKEATT